MSCRPNGPTWPPDQPLGPMRLTISAAANERYWRAAGVDHPLLRGGRALPADRRQPHDPLLPADLPRRDDPDPPAPQVPPDRARRAPSSITFGRVVARYEKRGREYVDIEVAVITADAPDQPLWTSWVTFTPTATLGSVVIERAHDLAGHRRARARVLAPRQLPLRRGDRGRARDAGTRRAGRAGRGPGVRHAARRVGRRLSRARRDRPALRRHGRGRRHDRRERSRSRPTSRARRSRSTNTTAGRAAVVGQARAAIWYGLIASRSSPAANPRRRARP